jgi:hypothetical protein
MRRLFCRIGFWFLRLGKWNLDVLDLITSMPLLEIEVVKRAKELSGLSDTLSAPGTSGEYKRHVVYAQLIKEFPNLTKRQIAMAIEIGLG